MGSSETEAGVVDCSVGSIVWVRRRNGSWWPGKILGPDELSASHLMSPRSGTPVKLLGREDASVDWYNLEKSKRVKPFRCGEFDDCIERAEASQGIPPKKREKYARREDAILHALELEKQLLEMKYGKLGVPFNGRTVKLLDDARKDSATSSECLAFGNGKHTNSNSSQHSKGLDSSLEDRKKGFPIQVKERNQLSGDADNLDVQPRMRGLHDLGLRSVPSKRKPSLLVVSNGSHKPALACVSDPLDGGLATENVIDVNNKKVLDKRKRSDEGQVEESLCKRRDRHRPLVQVLESSTKLAAPHSFQLQSDGDDTYMSVEEQAEDVGHATRSKYRFLTAKPGDNLEEQEVIPEQMEITTSKFEESNHPYLTGLCEENTSGSTEDTETDSSQTDSLGSDTDDGLPGLSDDVAAIELIPKTLGRSEPLGGHGSTSSDELDDLALPGDASHPFPREPIPASSGMSKWQLKGKRNSRNLTKRFPTISDQKFSKGMYDCDDDNSFERNLRPQMVGYGSRELGMDSTHNINWDDLAWNDQPTWKGYWEDTSEFYDSPSFGRHFGGRTKSILVDVDLKVQSSYQREHVPMISLMSKLNGKAIVGHPIPVETLENDSSELLLAAAGDYHANALDYETSLQPVWRTARRTANCRVPRPPHLSSTLDGDETAEHFQYVDQDRIFFGKLNSSHKATNTRKGASMERKLVRKPPKKISLSSSQKIRTLSSIGTQHNHNHDLKLHGSSSYHADGLIKPESLPTAVACIPVKLVFSRLYEELVARHQ